MIKKNILIIGGSGLIGSQLVKFFSKKNNVFNLDIKQKRDNSLFYKSDVTNPKKLKITLDKIFKNNKVIDGN